jgi:uncharacterized protein YdaL
MLLCRICVSVLKKIISTEAQRTQRYTEKIFIQNHKNYCSDKIISNFQSIIQKKVVSLQIVVRRDKK